MDQVEAQMKAHADKMDLLRKEYVTFGEEFATITLAKGITVDGTLVKKLTMREPTVRDNRAAAATLEAAAEMEVKLLANLCGVLPDALNDMTQRDYNRVQAAYTGFTD